MLVGRCSSQLSGHQNDQRNQKVTTSEPKPRDLQFRGPFLEMSFDLSAAQWRNLRFSRRRTLLFCPQRLHGIDRGGAPRGD
jgi:hypothetical protein